MTLDNVLLAGNSGIDGGGFLNLGSVFVSNSVITGNLAELGGGLFNGIGATFTGASTIISGNEATGREIPIEQQINQANPDLSPLQGGGGIFNDVGGELILDNTSITGNFSTGRGGGVDNLGDATISNSLVNQNTADDLGGAISNSSTSTLIDTDIIGNQSISASLQLADGFIENQRAGGVFNDEGGAIQILGGRFADNFGGDPSAPLSAPGLFSYDSVVVDGANFEGNSIVVSNLRRISDFSVPPGLSDASPLSFLRAIVQISNSELEGTSLFGFTRTEVRNSTFTDTLSIASGDDFILSNNINVVFVESTFEGRGEGAGIDIDALRASLVFAFSSISGFDVGFRANTALRLSVDGSTLFDNGIGAVAPLLTANLRNSTLSGNTVGLQFGGGSLSSTGSILAGNGVDGQSDIQVNGPNSIRFSGANIVGSLPGENAQLSDETFLLGSENAFTLTDIFLNVGAAPTTGVLSGLPMRTESGLIGMPLSPIGIAINHLPFPGQANDDLSEVINTGSGQLTRGGQLVDGLGNSRLFGRGQDLGATESQNVDGNNLVGTTTGDRLVGSNERDILRGLAGSDTLIGGPGDGDLGDDSLVGGPGDDFLLAFAGRDTLLGGRVTTHFEVISSVFWMVGLATTSSWVNRSATRFSAAGATTR
ncbi:MAG: hypothetical protein AAGH42_01810 [Pseudomonadota bacterium]